LLLAFRDGGQQLERRELLMNVLKYAFFLAADIALIGCTLHYIFIRPDNPAQLVKLAQLQGPKTFKDYLGWAYVSAAWFGIGISIYVAVNFLLSWMP
jgi:hypothetical protein